MNANVPRFDQGSTESRPTQLWFHHLFRVDEQARFWVFLSAMTSEELIRSELLARSEGHRPPNPIDSDAQEKFAPVHPEQDQPQRQQHRGALEHRGEGIAEELEGVRAEVRFERAGDEAVHRAASKTR